MNDVKRGKRLSVCVPTYNRVGYLRELLPVLLDEMKPIAQDVELLVVDNASTDETAAYLDQLLRCHEGLRTVHNSENIGADRNFLRCVECASGEFVWLFGDDDLPERGILGRVMAVLERSPGANLIVCLDHPRGVSDGRYADYRSALVAETDSNGLFALCHTLITCNIFRRQDFDLAYAERRIWTNYAHMFGLRRIFSAGEVVVLPNAIHVREKRAAFAQPIYFLTVKQGLYCLWLSFHGGGARLFMRGLLMVLSFFRELNRARILRRRQHLAAGIGKGER